MKKGNLKCPYCGEKLKFLEAFQIKTHKEYLCKKCDKISEIEINPDIKKMRSVLFVMVIAVIGLFSFFLKSYILGVLIVLGLFMLFYWQVPNFMNLSIKQSECNQESNETTR